MGNIQGYIERLHMGQTSNPTYLSREEKDIFKMNDDDDSCMLCFAFHATVSSHRTRCHCIIRSCESNRKFPRVQRRRFSKSSYEHHWWIDRSKSAFNYMEKDVQFFQLFKLAIS